MIYPVFLKTILCTTNTEGEHDEIRYEGRAMAALRENGTWSVRYTDAENHGQTALQGADLWVSVSRDGDTKSRLLFRVGDLLESTYVTPQGRVYNVHESHLFAARGDGSACRGAGAL